MKAVTFAATGHLHKLTKLFWKWTHCRPTDKGERSSALVSLAVVLGMMLGAVVGALAMHAGADQWLFVPVAIAVLGAVELHDAALEPPKGWGEQGQAQQSRTEQSRTAADAPKTLGAARPLLLHGGDSGGPYSEDGSGHACVAGRTILVRDLEVGSATAYEFMPAGDK
jgi:hypothetical protein